MVLLVEGLCPRLTSNIISQCKSLGISTITEFLLVNTEELAKKTKIAYKDLIFIQHFLLTKYIPFPQRADSLYGMLLESLYIMSTGSKRIDHFLKGGIYTGEVTEIHGSPGSGKTQFCLTLAANLVLDSENTVLYIDTNSNFNAVRLEQILKKKSENKMLVPEKLKMIRVVKVHDIYQLFDVMDSIKYHISKMDNEFFVHLKLIIIDSVTHLLSTCFGGKYLDGASFMNNLAQIFKIICSEHMLSVLVSNNTVLNGKYDVKAGLGSSWKYVPSVSLCIKRLKEINIRKIAAVKSCRNGLQNEVTFAITEDGITD